jgi:hypothetical protein
VSGIRSGLVKTLEVDFLLVDEVQDADWLQWEWVREHALSGSKVIAVGDDDQSIYRWHVAAGQEGMQRFVEEFGLRHPLRPGCGISSMAARMAASNCDLESILKRNTLATNSGLLCSDWPFVVYTAKLSRRTGALNARLRMLLVR